LGSINAGNFLTSWGTVSFSIRPLLHELVFQSRVLL
jgi:hypothetical protein